MRLQRIGSVTWLAACCAMVALAQTSAEQDALVEHLLDQMTLEEKLGQITQVSGHRPGGEITGPDANRVEQLETEIRAGGIGAILNAHGAEWTNRLQRIAVEESRLKIPLLFGNDVIHGYRTIFPIPLAESCSFDPAIVARSARVAAREARAAGTHWTFAPMVDICRDPRWGRIAEGAGEDPYLGALLAAARVRGFQGERLDAPDTLLACAKHYAAHGAPLAGRDYNTVDISVTTLHNVFLPPFAAAIDAGVGSLMTAFNEVGGVPASASPYLLDEILRQRWGFRGLVVSDWTSIEELVDHGFAEDEAAAARLALLAGVDLDMSSLAYRTYLADEIAAGRVSQEAVDRAVRRVLRAKVALGLFDQPYADATREAQTRLTAAHRAEARDVARHAIVLLKNEAGVLPLDEKALESIALIGPLADSAEDMLGTWAARGRAEDVTTLRAALQKRCGDKIEFRHARGCEVEAGTDAMIAEAVAVARAAEVAIVVVGESRDMSGEARCRTVLGLPGRQLELVRAVHATGTPTVVVLMNGRPLAIPWCAEHVPAIVEAWHLGVEAGPAVVDVLFGDFNPSGRLPVTFPRRVGQIPIHYAHKNTGRPPSDEYHSSKYIDCPVTPLYPFGYGLSYTTFAYGDLVVEVHGDVDDPRVTVQATVRNTGSRAGDEIVQLYIRDLVATMTRPVRQLRGVRRVSLEPGQQQRVRFTLRREDLGFYDNQAQYRVEPGRFRVWVAPHAEAGSAAEFELPPSDR